MLPLPLAPLLTPIPGCWAWLVSICGCTLVLPRAPPDTPAPPEAGGVAIDPPPVMPPVAPPLTPPDEVPAPAPTDPLPPTDPDVWALEREAAETAQTRARTNVFFVIHSSEGWSRLNSSAKAGLRGAIEAFEWPC